MGVWDDISADPQKGARLLVDEFGGRLFAAARLLCHDAAQAEDLTFRTLEQALLHIRQYRPTGSFYGWLYRILLNFHRMNMRKAGSSRLVYTDVLPELPDPQGDAASELIARQDAETVRAKVAELSPPLREVVVLRFFEELSLDEIASILDIRVGTVKSRLFNAKAQLQQWLRQDFEDRGGLE